MFNAKNIKNTIYFSFVVQIITSIIASQGLFEEVSIQDEVLKDILRMELLVQIVESSFYVWVILALKDYKTLTQRRYIDWVITTPTMLISTVIFMRYIEYKEKGKKIFTFLEIIEQEKETLMRILFYNWAMLFFGFMGESGKIKKELSVSIGFVFFYLSFKTMNEYAKETETGTNLFNFLVVVWSLYGFSALLENNAKNICYNLLDIVSKNFYGLYIYYFIVGASSQKIGNKGLPASIVTVKG